MKPGILVILIMLVITQSQSGSCHGSSSHNQNAPGANQSGAASKTNANTKTDMSNTAKDDMAGNDTWGGDHVRLIIRQDGADLEFDCAHGQIDKRFETDSEGKFDLPGRFFAEHGGPIRAGESNGGTPSRYIGRIQGTTMTLSIKFNDQNEPVDTFSLTRGSQGRLMKCK